MIRYFVASTTAIFFVLINHAMVEMCYAVLRLEYAFFCGPLRAAVWVCSAIYGIWYCLRKIKYHVKEYDGLVTSRYEDALRLKNEALFRKAQKKTYQRKKKQLQKL